MFWWKKVFQQTFQRCFNVASKLIWRSLRSATLWKRRLWHRCFPVNFAIFQRKSFFYKIPPVAASVGAFCWKLLTLFVKRSTLDIRVLNKRLFLGISRFYTEANIMSWRKLRFKQNTSHIVNTVKCPNIHPACFIHLKDKFCLTFIWQTNVGQRNLVSCKTGKLFFKRSCYLKPFLHWWNNLIRAKVNQKIR